MRDKKQKATNIIYEYFLYGTNTTHDVDLFILQGEEHKLIKMWNEGKEGILRDWINKHPGRRPFMWGEVDCRRWKDDPWHDCIWHGTLPLPRERINGNSDIQPPWSFGLNEKPYFSFGIPRSFCYYNDKIKHYSPANEEMLKNIFYESEASYLKRHGLFFPSEAKRLTENNFNTESAYQILK